MTVTIKRRAAKTIEEFEKQFDKKSNSGGSNSSKWSVRVGGKGPDGKPRNRMTVRFLTQPNEWVPYDQYWDPALGYPVIMTEENEEAYTARNIKPAFMHLAGALDVETGQVIALELKWSQVKEIQALRKDKPGREDITEYDIELVKRGEGKEGTEYRVNFEGKSPLDISRYPVPGGHVDWPDYLWSIIEAKVGTDTDDDVDAIEDDTDVAEDDTEPTNEELAYAGEVEAQEAPAKKRVLVKRKS